MAARDEPLMEHDGGEARRSLVVVSRAEEEESGEGFSGTASPVVAGVKPARQ